MSSNERMIKIVSVTRMLEKYDPCELTGTDNDYSAAADEIVDRMLPKCDSEIDVARELEGLMFSEFNVEIVSPASSGLASEIYALKQSTDQNR